MEIKDNFLNQEDFIKLQTFMMGSECSWYFNPYIIQDINPRLFKIIKIYNNSYFFICT